MARLNEDIFGGPGEPLQLFCPQMYEGYYVRGQVLKVRSIFELYLERGSLNRAKHQIPGGHFQEFLSLETYSV